MSLHCAPLLLGLLSIRFSKRLNSCLHFGCLLFAVAVQASSVKYEILDLGGTAAVPRDINNVGQVVGRFVNAAGAVHAFRWTEIGGIQDLGALDGAPGTASGTSEARGINDQGQIVGFSSKRFDINFPSPFSKTEAFRLARGFTWKNGQLSDAGVTPLVSIVDDHFPHLDPGEAHSELYAINNSGSAVGYATIMGEEPLIQFSSEFAAKRGPQGGWVLLSQSAIGMSRALAINSSGVAVGWYWATVPLARMFGPAGTVNINPFNAQQSMATAINDNGYIAGWFTTPATAGAFAILGDGLVNLNTWADPSFFTRPFQARATDINNRQQIVGITDFGGAVLWESGKMSPLTFLIPTNSGWSVLREANAINDRGWIVGTGTRVIDGQNVSRGFLLKPLEEALTIEVKRVAKVGEQFEAKVTLKLVSTDPLKFTFGDALLTTTNESVVTIGAVDAPEPFTLTTDDPIRSFPVPLTGGEPGIARLLSSVTVTDSRGRATVYSTDRTVVVSPVEVTLRVKPLVDNKSLVNMKLQVVTNKQGQVDYLIFDDQGERIDPKIEVAVKNISKKPVDAIIQGIDPIARDQSAETDRRIQVDGLPKELGKIAPNTSVVKEFALLPREDGRFEFNVLITGTFVENATVNFELAERGAPIAVGEPYPMEIELELITQFNEARDLGHGAVAVRPGGQARFLATVKNLTSNSTLKFTGFDTRTELNAQGGILTTPEGSRSCPPQPVDHELAADSLLQLSGEALTMEAGAPTGTITWILPENARLIDDLTEEETKLEPKDILVTSEITGWDGDPLKLRLIQDNSRPVAPPLTRWEVWGYFKEGVVEGIGQWTYNSFDSLKQLLTSLGHIDPETVAAFLGNSSRSIWEAAEQVAFTWSKMTPAQREEFIQNVGRETQRRALQMATHGIPLEVEELQVLTNVVAYARSVTYPLFSGVEDAYAANDPGRVAHLWGSVGANVALEVATCFIPGPEFSQYSKVAELARLAENADNVRLPGNIQEKLLRELRGPVSAEDALKAWGYGGEEAATTQEVVKALGIKLFGRERSDISIRLSEELKEAVLKPERMKPKGFSDLDRFVLGEYSPRVKANLTANGDLAPEAITMIYWPEENAIIAKRLKDAGVPDEVVGAAIERANARREEYQKYFPEFNGWREEGGIPVEFNYRENGATRYDSAVPGGPKRRFDFETIGGGQDPIIHVPRMADANGELRYITGDFDLVHISWLDGTPLDSRSAGYVYNVLSRCCGLQHGETISWIKDGVTIFKGKANQLLHYVTGEKALLEITGDSLRAVRINPEFSRLATVGRNHLIFFDAGTKSLQRALKLAELEAAIGRIVSRLPPRLILLPFLWIQRVGADDTSLGGQDWTFENSEDSVLLRKTETGVIEGFVGGAWVPWTPPADGAPVKLSPSTALSSDVAAGTSKVPVVELDQLWSDELAGHIDGWFAPGVTVVIAPGQVTQEVRKVLGLGSLVLDRPLQYSHPAGTLVAVVTSVRLLQPVLAVKVAANPAYLELSWPTAFSDFTLESAETVASGAWSPILDFSLDEQGGSVIATIPRPIRDSFFRLVRP